MKNLFNTIRQQRLLWIIILFLMLPLLAFPELIVGQQTLYWTDLSWIHYPRHIFAASEWLAGRVPLWDPYEDTGIPLLAESQIGGLYPFSVLFLSSLSPSLELSLFILLHFTLAACFTLILTRSLGMGRAASTVAGLSYSLGGFLMSQVPNLNIMTGAVWLPLILFGVIQTTRQRRWGAAMLAGIPLALQILTAQPQIVFYTLVIIVGYGTYRLITDLFLNNVDARAKLRYALHTALLLTVTIVCGLLLAAPQLLPTLELQQLSIRSQERGLKFLTENSWPPVMGLNLLLPGLFGNNVVGFKGGDPFQEVFIYIGLIPLLLVFWSGGQRQKRETIFFWLLLLGTVSLALGRNTPLYEYVIQYLPGFDLFRIPSRWLMGVNLALAVLASFGLETVLQKGVSRLSLATIWVVGLILLLVLGLIWIFRADLLIWNSAATVEFRRKLIDALLNKGFGLDPVYQSRLWPSWLTGLSTPAVLMAVNLMVAVVLFTLYAAHRLSRRAFAGLVIIAIAFDLIAAGGTTINPTKPAAWWDELSGGARYVLDNVGEARIFPLGMGSEAAAVSHLGQYFPSAYRVRSAGGHGSSLLLARYNTFLHEADPVQAIQVVGARYLLTLGQMGADVAATYPLVYSDENSFVYENKNPLPRVFIVHQALQIDHPDQALAYFQTRSVNPQQTVILESDTPVPMPGSPATSENTATISEENSQFVEIEAHLADDGYLVLLDTYYPDWVATVDEQPTPIYRANYIGRAVFLPEGSHIVRFEYKPLSFQLGLWLSAIGLVILTITALIDHWPKRAPVPD
ncbi:MAG: YfhO family protein [Anaerolineae bacterium]|nr:YfhO family protein [Anaerolineae bacterium]